MGSMGPSITQHNGDLTMSRSSTPDSQATVTERPSSEASDKETPENQASDPIDSRTATEIYHTAAYIRHQIDELHPADQDMVHEYQASESHRVYAAYDIGSDAEGTSYIPSPQDEYFHYNGLCRLPRKIDYLAFTRGHAYPGAAIGLTRERGYHREDYEFYAVAPEHFRHLTRCTHAYNAIVEEMEKQRKQSVGFVGRSLWIPNWQGQGEGRGERHGQLQGQCQNQWQDLQHQQHQQQQRRHNHHHQQQQQQQQQQTPHHAPPSPVPHPQQPQHPVLPRPPHHLQHRQQPQQPQRPAHPVQRPILPVQHLSAPPPQNGPVSHPHPQPQPQPHPQAPALLPAALVPQVSHLPQQLPHLGPWHGMTRSEKKRAKNKKKRQAQAARKRAQYADQQSAQSSASASTVWKRERQYSATHWPDADVWAEEIEGYEGVVLEEYGDGEGEGEGDRADGVEQDPQQQLQQEPQPGTKTEYPTFPQYHNTKPHC